MVDACAAEHDASNAHRQVSAHHADRVIHGTAAGEGAAVGDVEGAVGVGVGAAGSVGVAVGVRTEAAGVGDGCADGPGPSGGVALSWAGA
jgi:hypothetical protein